MSFAPSFLNEAQAELLNAPYGHKSIVAKKWAAIIGITPQHLYRIFNAGTERKRTTSSNAETIEWARTIFTIKKTPPEEAGELSTEDALAIAVNTGQIPEAALDVAVGTYNRIARREGWTKVAARANRFQASRPNQAHHFDASTSKFFYIARRSGDDYILKMHRPAKHYKNKPIPVDQLRPWIYGLVDDHSGRLVCRYVAAHGESSADSMQFLAHAWSQIGLPEKLFADQGMLKKALPSRDLIDRLGIELPEMMPYHSRGHGKIERPWRTAWQKFEKPFFAASGDWSKFEISLTEMNQQLCNYVEDKYNQLPHRFEKDITRLQAWNRINLSGGVVQIPENALNTVARRAKRKIDITGMIHYDGQAYEVKGLYDAWVWLFEGVFDGDQKLVAQDIQTGIKYPVREFKPLEIDHFRAHKETPHQAIVKEIPALALTGQGLYAQKKSDALPVVHMPIKTKEERTIDDPFNVDQYASLKEAMQEFSEIVCVFMTAAERKEVERLITTNGLKKAFVKDLALEISGAIEQQRAAI